MAGESSPMTVSQYATAIDRAIRNHFVDEYKLHKPMVEKVMQVVTQEDWNEKDSDYTGFGALSLITENEVYPTDVMMEGYVTTYTPKKYGSTVGVSREFRLGDKSGIAKGATIGKAQGKAVARKIEEQGASVFNNGFNTAFTSYGDGKPLFSTAHNRIDGGAALSNASASGIVLSHANLQTATTALRTQLDGRGQLVSGYPKKLLVPPALEHDALVITKSRQRSGVADNDVNAYTLREYTGGSIDVCVWDYLTSPTAWFVLGEDHKIMWKWMEKPKVAEFDESVGFLNDQFVWKVSYLASTGWSDWRHAWGSKGDGLAYTS